MSDGISLTTAQLPTKGLITSEADLGVEIQCDWNYCFRSVSQQPKYGYSELFLPE